MTPIYDGFKNWQDVANDFSGARECAAALREIPEPEQVLVAAYEQADYEGYAWVVYRNGSKYYTVQGSHCSCYGLEGQWTPEEYESTELLLAALKKGDWAYGAKATHISAVISMLEAA